MNTNDYNAQLDGCTIKLYRDIELTGYNGCPNCHTQYALPNRAYMKANYRKIATFFLFFFDCILFSFFVSIIQKHLWLHFLWLIPLTIFLIWKTIKQCKTIHDFEKISQHYYICPKCKRIWGLHEKIRHAKIINLTVN